MSLNEIHVFFNEASLLRKKLKQVEEENLALKSKNAQLKTDYNNLKVSTRGIKNSSQILIF